MKMDKMKGSANTQTPVPNEPRVQSGTTREVDFYSQRHLRFGWWALLVYLCMGIVLEALRAFKVWWYLDVANETRRLMWTLGHAHGTLLALINLAFAATLPI